MDIFASLDSLKNPSFRRLYMAEVVSLLGDAITWVGIALLAFQLAGDQSAVVLSVALTLRVAAFVIFSPYAGVLADRLDRKNILIITHLCRMSIIALLPFVQTVTQIYIIVLGVNIFRAFFVPTLKASIPQLVPEKSMYRKAISLYSGTYQVLGILGPAVAGALAGLFGARTIFFVDAGTFLAATAIIVTLPGSMKVDAARKGKKNNKKTWAEIKKVTAPLFFDPKLRFVLLLQLAASVAGAQILVNTVGYVKGALLLGDTEYGWVMSAFGLGAAVAAFLLGSLQDRFKPTHLALAGTVVISLAILPGNVLSLPFLIIFWVIAGFGQSFVNVPMQTLIADQIPEHEQGKVYGAHFAWSHLWWALAYPLAGLLGTGLDIPFFLWGGVIGLFLIMVCYLLFYPGKSWVLLNGDHQ
jgi:NRE family putative nickel resistance protein-like MFS transporter